MLSQAVVCLPYACNEITALVRFFSVLIVKFNDKETQYDGHKHAVGDCGIISCFSGCHSGHSDPYGNISQAFTNSCETTRTVRQIYMYVIWTMSAVMPTTRTPNSCHIDTYTSSCLWHTNNSIVVHVHRLMVTKQRDHSSPTLSEGLLVTQANHISMF